jgi:glycosyltransferase involved in cell wall biosynthesis
LEKVLEGLHAQTVDPWEILVADDGSDPATRGLIQRWLPRLAVPLHHVWHEDLGFRKTMILNKSVAVARGDYVVLLDGDCVPHCRFVEDHAGLAEEGFWVQGRRCFVEEEFVPRFRPGSTPVFNWCLRGRITGVAKAFRYPVPVIRRNTAQRGIIGCNMGFWRNDLIAVNGFDEDYSGWGIGEDSDVGTRLYHLGRPRKFVYGRAVVYHLNHPMASRHHVAESQARLAETIRTRKLRCELGLDQYLNRSAHEA